MTATDTGVGKTFVSCALAYALRARGRDVGVMKPVATGCARVRSEDGVERLLSLRSDDAVKLVEAASAGDPARTADPMGLVNPVSYEPPLAPTVAARIAGGRVDRDRIFAAYAALRASHEYLIVEGIGGLLVPLVPQVAPARKGEGPYTVRDLAREMAAPLLVVSHDRLGTINHTALTAESARRAGLVVKGIVLNRAPGADPPTGGEAGPPPDGALQRTPGSSAEPRAPAARIAGARLLTETNADEIEALTGVPVVARLGPLGSPAEAARALTDGTLDALF